MSSPPRKFLPGTGRESEMGGLMAFDLDGTLTQHKTPLEQENRCVLDELRGRGWSL